MCQYEHSLHNNECRNDAVWRCNKGNDNDGADEFWRYGGNDRQEDYYDDDALLTNYNVRSPALTRYNYKLHCSCY